VFGSSVLRSFTLEFEVFGSSVVFIVVCGFGFDFGVGLVMSLFVFFYV